MKRAQQPATPASPAAGDVSRRSFLGAIAAAAGAAVVVSGEPRERPAGERRRPIWIGHF